MRQLRFNYVFPVGYVQPFPSVKSGSIIYPVIYGLSATPTATQSEINAFSAVPTTSKGGQIVFPNGQGKYLNILVPFQYGPVDSFVFNNLSVRWPMVNTTVADNGLVSAAFVNVDGVDYAFNWYVSQYPQNGTNITVTIPS